MGGSYRDNLLTTTRFRSDLSIVSPLSRTLIVIAASCVVLCCVVLFRYIVLYRGMRCYVMLCCVTLCCVVLCCVVLCCVVLCCVVLYKKTTRVRT